jgi:hypothetical protein
LKGIIFIEGYFLFYHEQNLQMLTEKECVARIRNLRTVIPSKTKKAAYDNFKIEGDILMFRRVATKTNWTLNIKVVYGIYVTNKFINTSVIKRATNGRVNSPSVALLMAIGCIDEKGNRIG